MNDGEWHSKVLMYRPGRMSLSTMNHTIVRFMFTVILLVGHLPGAEMTGVLDWQKIVAEGEAQESGTKSDAWAITRGTFEMASGMATEPSVTCHYAVPAAKGRVESARRQDVVYFFHTPSPGEKSILDNALCNKLVGEFGMTAFGIAFQKSSESSLFYDESKRDKFYAFEKSGSFTAIVSAWAKLRQQLSITKPRFFLFGYSAGGIGVQRFAEEYPELCDGVVTANGHSFLLKNKASCPFLIIHTYGDWGAPQGEGLAYYYRSIGTPCVRLCLTPNWDGLNNGNAFVFHGLNGSATPLAVYFFAALSDLRRSKQANGTTPPPLQWPYATAEERPELITQMRDKNWQQTYAAASYTAVAVPSARFYAEMMKITPPSKVLRQALGDFSMHTKPAAGRKPIGLVTIAQSIKGNLEGAEPKVFKLLLGPVERDSQYAAEQGFVAIAAKDSEGIPGAMASFYEGSPGAKSLPISSIQFHPEPQQIQNLVGQVNPKRLVIVLKSSDDALRYLPILQKCVAKSIKIQVLVSCNEPSEYQTFLSPISEAAGKALFSAFQPKGKDAQVSLHQQQLEAAVAFITKK